jgi:hypothetical protein
LQRQDRAETERFKRRQVQAAERVGEMFERVGARVAVGGGVGQRADPAGIQDDYKRPRAQSRSPSP